MKLWRKNKVPKRRKLNEALEHIIEATTDLEKYFDENPEIAKEINKKLGIYEEDDELDKDD